MLYSFPPNDFDEIERGYESSPSAGGRSRRLRRRGRALRARGPPDRDRLRLRDTRKRSRRSDTGRASASTSDPSHFEHQFLDSAAFVTEFADRIYHVHVKDSISASTALVDPRRRT
jgi:hypothetical protein